MSFDNFNLVICVGLSVEGKLGGNLCISKKLVLLDKWLDELEINKNFLCFLIYSVPIFVYWKK